MNAVRMVVRGIGELFITAGLVLMLFCAYQLVWTNVEAQRAQNEVEDSIVKSWSMPEPKARPGAGGDTGGDDSATGGDDSATGGDDSATGGDESPGETLDEIPGEAPGEEPGDEARPRRVHTADFGKGLAILRIPRLGEGYKVPVVEGVRASDLSRGVGHYPTTAPPGAVGNFALAGHRATNGEPFRNLDRMRRGDSIVVETRDTWLTYVVDRTRIVRPSDTWVIDPVPGRPGAEPRERLLTLTTCHPRWSSTYRLIVFSHLASKRAKADGPPPALRAKAR